MAIELSPLALHVLKNNQRKLDQDGVEIGVSRQALEELIAAYEAAKPVAGGAVADERSRCAHIVDQYLGSGEDARYALHAIRNPVAPMSTSGEMVERVARAIREAGMKREGSSKLTLGTVISEELARAAIAASRLEALEGLVVRPGWKLVPVEPTEEMMEHYKRAFISEKRFDGAEVYRAMIAAAPAPPDALVSPEGGVGL